MNSDKAAAVRDAVNGCPDVVNEENLCERDGDPMTTHRGKTFTGDRVKVAGSRFRPAYIEESGTVGNGDGADRPVYVEVLKTVWTEQTDVRSLSPELVYEIAKHDCRIRFYPPDHRLEGDIWITDHLRESIKDSDDERCSECRSTYFKLRGDTPVCAKCGEPKSATGTPQREAAANANL
jgi:hypothetical protein